MSQISSFVMQRQPDLVTCGPTCLHALYAHYGDEVALASVIDDVSALEEGGTLGVMLGLQALSRGYRARLYTYNLELFDPSWFKGGIDIAGKLRMQAKVKRKRKLRLATSYYLRYLESGGELIYRELNAELLYGFLTKGIPILAGLSSTYLYDAERVDAATLESDDVRGKPEGHFVVIHGLADNQVSIADPYAANPICDGNHYYRVSVARVIGAIMLGAYSYDANLLVVTPPERA